MPPALVRAPGDAPGGDQESGGGAGASSLRRGRHTGAEDMGRVEALAEEYVHRLLWLGEGEEIVGWIR